MTIRWTYGNWDNYIWFSNNHYSCEDCCYSGDGGQDGVTKIIVIKIMMMAMTIIVMKVMIAMLLIDSGEREGITMTGGNSSKLLH